MSRNNGAKISFWFLHFKGHNQFGPQILTPDWSPLFSTCNEFDPSLPIIANSLIENIYMANGTHCWHT